MKLQIEEIPLFNFIKNRFGAVKPTPETQRETFERALSEVNAIVALMSDKPKVTLDPATGSVSFELPDQMPDEALALPAPEPETEPEAEPTIEADTETTAEPETAPKAETKPAE